MACSFISLMISTWHCGIQWKGLGNFLSISDLLLYLNYTLADIYNSPVRHQTEDMTLYELIVSSRYLGILFCSNHDSQILVPFWYLSEAFPPTHWAATFWNPQLHVLHWLAHTANTFHNRGYCIAYGPWGSWHHSLAATWMRYFDHLMIWFGPCADSQKGKSLWASVGHGLLWHELRTTHCYQEEVRSDWPFLLPNLYRQPRVVPEVFGWNSMRSTLSDWAMKPSRS